MHGGNDGKSKRRRRQRRWHEDGDWELGLRQEGRRRWVTGDDKGDGGDDGKSKGDGFGGGDGRGRQ